jgi:hypothetical protein
MFMHFHFVKTCIRNPFLFFISFFTLTPSLVHGRNADANPDRRVYNSARGGEFFQVSIFDKLVCQTIGR